MKVYGKTIESLFINSAKGLFSIIFPDDLPMEEKEERRIYIEAEMMEDLLISWLNELISIFYTYYFYPKCYNIEIKDKDKKIVNGVIKGSYIKPDKLEQAREVKSAAYSNVRIKNSGAAFNTIIILDV